MSQYTTIDKDLKKGPHASITSPPPKSKAARFNAHTLRKLQAAVDNDPEINLMTQMPMDYTTRLIEFQGEGREESREIIEKSETIKRQNGDIRDCLQASDPADIVWPLSSAVLGLLEETSHIAEPLPDGLSQRLLNLMQTSEVLWKSLFPEQIMVFKCDAGVVVKAVRRVDDDTEYTTLQYLECHKPDIPAPRPLGYVRMSGITFIFQTYKPSTTLATTDGSALGGVAGEGCKDIRRHLRKSEKPIRSLTEFEEFLFSSPHPGGQVLTELIRQLYPALPTEMKIVFTHGDLRPDNITVDMDDCNQWVVTGLLDWEYSGFYPEYCEAFKCTNCLAPYEEHDWYLFLPGCISPKRYAHWWLLDRVREARVV
ncbi:Phosphotransferase enzyme family [Aspergillus sclerotialis]|uniref:Phosphotransferase enzyme family n=1 Tax=Aspergillus sclerotialis TaxID=2070753 RepID=A0A3A2ZJC4_9EURO|nr:Phosphotransferase enzyme family [Aspergillus sclerotialis]